MLIRTGTHNTEATVVVATIRRVVTTVTNRRDDSVEVPRATEPPPALLDGHTLPQQQRGKLVKAGSGGKGFP